MKVDVDKLFGIKFIRIVDYPRWAVNVAREKKSTAIGKPTKWCICTNFNDLNEACPKDNFAIMAVAYFTKGSKVEPLMTTYEPKIRAFI